MSVTNVSKASVDQKIKEVRNAIEHRATWMYLLLDEAEKAGADWEKIGRNAVHRCGCFHGKTIFTPTDDLKDFADQFANDSDVKIFEMEVEERSDDRFCVEFNYCPLVAAWLKQTTDEDKIATLCDIAMDGDRGIVAQSPSFVFKLGDTIAKGGKVCYLEVLKKK